jgi:hypothetical protein
MPARPVSDSSFGHSDGNPSAPHRDRLTELADYAGQAGTEKRTDLPLLVREIQAWDLADVRAAQD